MEGVRYDTTPDKQAAAHSVTHPSLPLPGVSHLRLHIGPEEEQKHSKENVRPSEVTPPHLGVRCQ
ncbi:hypothetical protein BDV98DRAFT_570126 [Pterulicium gracile]|uniref:Uncharacterized protein n=1 Tax=Pterulicium gracile TaxID=1884261 RepID=A0A5C3QDQ4_9AGAR|nr:hypothetical protein BDV98DRAFT_570126 [Pterula gracilis]